MRSRLPERCVNSLDFLNDARPAKLKGGLAGALSQPRNFIGLRGQARGQVTELAVVDRLGHHSVLARADELAGRRMVEGQHRQATRHRLGRHVAEGLGEAGKEEHISGRVVAGQFLALADAREHGLGTAPLQCLARRPVADEHQFAVRSHLPNALEGGSQHRKVFLIREPADVEHRQGLRGNAPRFPQLHAALRGVKALRVHPARHDAQVCESLRGQLSGQRARGHHRAAGSVMEPTQISHDRSRQPADSVVRAVGVKVGAEFGGHREAEPPGRRQCREAQRPFRDDVHHVRALGAPEPREPVHRRQSHLELAVFRNRHAGDEHLANARSHRAFVCRALAWADESDLVSILAQAFHHLRDGLGHAVDFRWVSLRDNGEMQPPCCNLVFGQHWLPRGRVVTHFFHTVGRASYGLKTR